MTEEEDLEQLGRGRVHALQLIWKVQVPALPAPGEKHISALLSMPTPSPLV